MAYRIIRTVTQNNVIETETLDSQAKTIATLCGLGLITYSGQGQDYAIAKGKDWTHIEAALTALNVELADHAELMGEV